VSDQAHENRYGGSTEVEEELRLVLHLYKNRHDTKGAYKDCRKLATVGTDLLDAPKETPCVTVLYAFDLSGHVGPHNAHALARLCAGLFSFAIPLDIPSDVL
jgi:hypothetical protein